MNFRRAGRSQRSATTGRRRATARHGTAGVLVLVAVLMAFPSTALAQPRLDVQVGFGGRHRSGTDLVVRVDVAADRLINGALHIVSGADGGTSPTTVILPVEVAGGSTKRFLAVVPTVTAWAGSVRVDLIENGDVIGSTTALPDDAREDELVGVLPSLSGDLAATEPLSVPLGLARLYPIDDTWLSAGPGSIDALGTVVASADDLNQLSAVGRNSLATWLHGGGTLVLDEPPGPVPGFDVSAATTPTTVGRGRVITTGGALARGEWAGALAPTALRHNSQGLAAELTGEVAWFGGPLANSLATDAGFGLPALALVLPAMGVYSLLVGPLTWFVLKRTGRSRLLWIVLPALAALFTAMVWIFGATQRDKTNDAHGTMIEIDDGTAFARSVILRSSRNGGTSSLDLPAGWRPVSSNDEVQFGRQPGVAATTTIRPLVDATRIESELDAGQFVMFGGSGLAPTFDDGLLATATSTENGRIVGTITNQLDVELEEVALFAGSAAVNIGTIGAGVTVDFELDAPEVNIRFAEPVEYALWPDSLEQFNFGGSGPAGTDTAVNVDLWSRYINTNTGRARPVGQLTVAAWTAELPAPIDQSVIDGRTLVVAHFPVEVTSGVLTDVSGPRALLRGPDQNSEFEDFDESGGGFVVGSAWRLDVPAGVDPAGLALRLPPATAKIRLWVDQEWVTVEGLAGGLFAIPPGAFDEGSLYVQPFVNFDTDPLLGRSFSLQTPDPDAVLKQDLFDGEVTS